MAWLEMTLNTPQGSVNDLVTELTALGFEDLCIEDQQEFESFLEENREYWDYIDESLEKQLQGLSRVKLYLEDTDAGNLKKLRPRRWGSPWWCCPIGYLRTTAVTGRWWFWTRA